MITKKRLVSCLLAAAAVFPAAPGAFSSDFKGEGRPLVFIHGFKGAELADHSGAVQWITPLQALGLGKNRLALPIAWKNGVQETDDIKATRVLGSVYIIPKLLGENIYGPWLEQAKTIRAGFFPFAYDWRRDNFESVALFERFIKGICEREHADSVDVVAHSMGGLILLAALNRDPARFHKVVFAGVPFHAGVGFLPDMHVGTRNGLNGKILSPQVLFSFPSVYTLFADDRTDTFDSKNQPLPVDFYEVSGWKNNRLGIFADLEGDTAREEAFLKTTLEHAKAFRQLLKPHEPSKLPPALVILGYKYPTLDKVVKNGSHGVKGWDFEAMPKVQGDGRVTSNNLPPEGMKYELYYSVKDHGNLLNDPKMIDVIKKFLNH